MQKGISYYFFLTCVFLFPKKFPRTSFLMIQMTEEQLSNRFYVYITCFGIQVEKNVPEKLLRNVSIHNMNKKLIQKGGKGAPFVGL